MDTQERKYRVGVMNTHTQKVEWFVMFAGGVAQYTKEEAEEQVRIMHSGKAPLTNCTVFYEEISDET